MEPLHIVEKCLTSALFAVFFVLTEEGTFANLRNCRTLFRLERKKTHDELFEATRKVSTLNSLEIGVVALVLDHIVVLVAQDLRAVRELALNHNEQEHTH